MIKKLYLILLLVIGKLSYAHPCMDYNNIIDIAQINPLISCNCTGEEIASIATLTACYIQILQLTHTLAARHQISPEAARVICTLVSYGIGKTCVSQIINILYCLGRIFGLRTMRRALHDTPYHEKLIIFDILKKTGLTKDIHAY